MRLYLIGHPRRTNRVRLFQYAFQEHFILCLRVELPAAPQQQMLVQPPLQMAVARLHVPVVVRTSDPDIPPPPHGCAAPAFSVSTTVIPSTSMSFLPAKSIPCSRTTVSKTCSRGSPPVFIVICLVAWS